MKDFLREIWPPILAFIVLALLFIAQRAYAHDDAAWIMNNPATSHCCGPNDCKPISEEELDFTPDSGVGVKATGEIIPYTSLKPSIDGRYWRCVMYQNRTRCLFQPPIGF